MRLQGSLWEAFTVSLRWASLRGMTPLRSNRPNPLFVDDACSQMMRLYPSWSLFVAKNLPEDPFAAIPIN